MSEPTLDDLRVWAVNERGERTVPRDLTPAEFDRIAREQGYVKRPVCERCKGNTGWLHPDGTFVHMVAGKPCPSCGGTGFGRLVALDGIDVEGLREAIDDHMGTSDDYANEYMPVAKDHHFTIVAAARRVLAALDGGQE